MATESSVLYSRHRRLSSALAARPERRWRLGRPLFDGEDRPAADSGPGRRWTSRQLHRMGALAAHAWTGLAVAVAVVAWVAYGAAIGFPSWWETALYSTTSAVTVVLLFALQHLQTRDQTAIQRKLDEILRALPAADNRLIALEEAPDEALEALTELNREDRLT